MRYTDRVAAERHLRFHCDLLALAGLRDLTGMRVLDAGSGFGMGLVVCVLLGAAEAHGIEYVPDAVDAVSRYLGKLPSDLAARITNRPGDAAAIPYPDESMDVLFSIEAISHYLDVPAFIRESHRVLRPGGVMIISDGNNGSNPMVRRKTHDIWRAFEQGPDGVTVDIHTVRESYRTMRLNAIREAYPSLPRHDAERIAGGTAAYSYEQTLAAVERFLDDGRLPSATYRPGEVAISPSGMAMERLFRPTALAREISEAGFSAAVYGYWGGAAGSPVIRTLNRMLAALTPVTLVAARGFRVVARKHGQA